MVPAALVALAVLLGVGPGRRASGRLHYRSGGSAAARGGRGEPHDGRGPTGARIGRTPQVAPAGSRARRPWVRPSRGDPCAVLSAAVTAVAAELRAGRPPGDAWREVLGVPVGADGVPAASDVVAAVSPRSPGRWRGPPSTGGGRPGQRTDDRAGRVTRKPARLLLRRRVAGVLAATRLATELGAPLAGVLDGCARSLTADADAETGLRAALAGPAQTTRLLTWLPALGVGLGTLLGADPVGVLAGGGVGSAAGLGGLGLTLLGRMWVGRMVTAAREAGAGDRHD